MDTLRHDSDVGRRVLEESIRMQQRVLPLPPEPVKNHLVLHLMGGLISAVVLVALALVLLPPGTG